MNQRITTTGYKDIYSQSCAKSNQAAPVKLEHGQDQGHLSEPQWNPSGELKPTPKKYFLGKSEPEEDIVRVDPNGRCKQMFRVHFYTSRKVLTVFMDETLAREVVRNLQIAEWTLTPDKNIRLLNLGTEAKPHMVEFNRHLKPMLAQDNECLLREFRDIFA